MNRKVAAAVLIGVALLSSGGWAGSIHEAIEKGNIAQVRGLLKQNPKLANTKDETGATPLHWVAFCGDKAVASLLLSKGSKVNAKDQDGATPLHWAALFGQKAVVSLLISKGADVNSKDKEGWTPLDAATGHKVVITLLRQHGGKSGHQTALKLLSRQEGRSGQQKECRDFSSK